MAKRLKRLYAWEGFLLFHKRFFKKALHLLKHLKEIKK